LNTRVLFVDDDTHALRGFERTMRRHFEVELAPGPREGLEIIDQQEEPFAAVVADMNMPGMHGIQFLQKVERVSPQTVRLMLTGHPDMATAMKAVNDGHIFRFLTKPCPPGTLKKSLEAAVELFQTRETERELLENTFRGSISVLSDVLAVANPIAFGRSQRVHRMVVQLYKAMQRELGWEQEVAAMLSHLGCVTVPSETLEKAISGEHLYWEERRLLHRHPRVAYDLLAPIPRLDKVREIIRWQNATLEPEDDELEQEQGKVLDEQEEPKERRIPFAARVLKVAIDFDTLESGGLVRRDALKAIIERKGQYDPEVIAALRRVLGEAGEALSQALYVKDMRTGMILSEGVTTRDGLLIVARGTEISPALMEKLRTWAELDRLVEPLIVETTTKVKVQDRD
jgi:response regulator RpfG family c-di-GMP phosphodiesterase